MNINYFMKLFEEFKRVYGIKDSFGNFLKYKAVFNEWINLRKGIALNYVQLLNYMVSFNLYDSVVEFGKGNFDTVSYFLNNYVNKIMVVSSYADTIESRCGKSFVGTLVVNGNSPVIKRFYDNKFNIWIGLDTLMIQTPFSENEIKPFLSLAKADQKLIIGTYGSLDDLDREDNLQRIELLASYFSMVSGRDVYFTKKTENGNYLSAVIISSVSKKLSKTK